MDDEVLRHRWYVVVNDMIGGYAIATMDKPLSEIEGRFHEVVVVADMVGRDVAHYIAHLHNTHLGGE